VIHQNISIKKRYDIKNKINIIFSNFEKLISNWNLLSELSIVNQTPVGKDIKISLELGQLIEKSEYFRIETGGWFDARLGLLIRHLGFHKNQINLPPLDIPEKNSYLLNRNDNHYLFKKNNAFEWNLSAMTEGLIIQQIQLLLKEEKINHYLFEIGGEITVHGTPIDGSSWNIEIEPPNKKIKSSPIYTQLQSGETLGVSGNYKHCKMLNGQIISHIINPHTMSANVDKAMSVSVIHNDAINSDVWATALMAMDKTTRNEFILKKKPYCICPRRIK
jgi:thiamine biosynthesis lipoprotein